MRPRRLGALLALLPLLLGVERPPGLGDVSEVRHWSYPDYTRVVVELTRPVDEAEVRRLGADARAGRPERLYLDLDGVWVGRRFADGIPVGDGLLRGVRLGQNTRTRARLVIDLEHYDRHRLLRLSAPDRLVVDVYGQREGAETLRWPVPENGHRSRLSMPLRSVQTVVVDPGHGGRDTGAIGLGGTREKDVNLRLAHKLAERLEAAGFRVVLTRRDDRALSLEERTAIAEAARGDVFVSLHANAAPRRSARGFEIYYLDEEHQRHSLRVAARENGVPRDRMDALQRTLARLRTSEASLLSRDLAGSVQREVAGSLSRRARNFEDLGVKKGPFYVLFLSSMPAILVEAGFLTNRDDVKHLRDDAWLGAMASAIARGVERYRDGVTDVASGPRP